MRTAVSVESEKKNKTLRNENKNATAVERVGDGSRAGTRNFKHRVVKKTQNRFTTIQLKLYSLTSAPLSQTYTHSNISFK